MQRPATVKAAAVLALASLAAHGLRTVIEWELISAARLMDETIIIFAATFTITVLPVLLILYTTIRGARTFLALITALGLGVFIVGQIAIGPVTMLITFLQIGSVILLYAPSSSAWIKRNQRSWPA